MLKKSDAKKGLFSGVFSSYSGKVGNVVISRSGRIKIAKMPVKRHSIKKEVH